MKDDFVFKDLFRKKKKKNNSYLLNFKNINLFIDEEMVDIYLNNKDVANLLDVRKKKIMKAEKKFVDSLDIEYSDADWFLIDF